MALAALIAVPFLIKYMGIEAYGLVGFYIALQGMFQLLDIGLSTTISREATQFKNRIDQAKFIYIKKYAQYFFIGIGVVAAAIFFVYTDTISNKWIKNNSIDPYSLNISIRYIGLIVVIRWISCLYRGIVVGFEEQVWLSKFNLIITTLRYILVIPLVYYNNEIARYFGYQLLIATFELFVLYLKASKIIGKERQVGCEDVVSWKNIKGSLKFAVGIASTSSIWILVTQLDKIYLSTFLSLKEYGQYSATFLLASGITLINNPIALALMPRLTSIASLKNDEILSAEYRKYTKLTALITMPPTILVILFAKQILFGWTENEELANASYLILMVYASANLLVNIGGIAYCLQYAKGNIKYHVIGNVISTILYLPLMYILINLWGAIGAAIAWLSINVLYLLIWVPIIHIKLSFYEANKWFRNDIVKVFLICLIPLLIFYLLDQWVNLNLDRYLVIVKLTLYLLCTYTLILIIIKKEKILKLK